MARKIDVALPGQSRSHTCPVRGCHRLAQHRGDCRKTLTRSASPKAMVGGVEVLSADKYTVQPDVEPKARKARKPKVVVLPMAEYTRLVAASAKVTRRSRFVQSGRPSARLA